MGAITLPSLPAPPARAVPNPAFASPTSPAPTTLAPPLGQFPPSGQSVAPPSGRAVAPPTLPSWDSVFSLRSSTLQHVPKGVRNAWASLVSSVFSAINHNPLVLDNWRKLFLLPRCILANPLNGDGDRLGWRKLQGIVNLRIRKWQRGEILNLWEEFVSSTTSIRHRRGNGSKGVKGSSPESLRAINVRRSKLVSRAGQYRKGIQALTSEGLAPTSESTLGIMRSKHPQSPPPPCPSSTPPLPISVSPSFVSKALHSFPSDSAPGPSLLRTNNLKEAVRCPSAACGARALQAITQTINHLASGGAPEEVAPYLCGAILLPIKKKSGGLRPIAVGEVLRRLTSKCLSWAVLPDAIDILAPLQVGVGVKAGCEAVIHSVAHILEKQDLPSLSRWTLLVDFSNAFNCVSREHMANALRLVLPGLSRWIEWCYCSRSILRFGDHSLLSCCGVQQGDPLGPLCFALTLQPVIERISRELPNLLCNAWYLDGGTPQDLAAALKIIEEEGPPRGLQVKWSKSLLYIPPGDDHHQNKLPPDIPISSSGFCLLGVPLGSDFFREQIVLGIVEKICCTLECLKDLGDSQLQSTLLRSCLSLPKFNYSLRTCPPSLIQNATTLFDNSIREALEDITGSPLSDWSWSKANLPSSLGGLNLRSAVLHAPAAYVSSITESIDLVSKILRYTPEPPRSLPSAISSLASSANMASWHLLEDIDIPLRQKSLSHAIDEACFSTLVETAPDVRSKALALSTSLPHAGDWLNVVPSPALGLSLFDQEFCLCLDY